MKQTLKFLVRQALGASRGIAMRRTSQAQMPLRTLDRQALRAVTGGAGESDSPKSVW